MSIRVSQALSQTNVWNDDPLLLLPRKQPQNFHKNQNVYSSGDRAESIFLVVRGAVKLSRVSESGRETVLDFIGSDEFFGESAIRQRGIRNESAIAIDDLAVMEWDLSDLSRIILRCPELGGALLRLMADRINRAHARIERMAVDPIAKRIVRTLVRLGEEFGEPGEGASVHVMPVTHQLLAKYIGTSR